MKRHCRRPKYEAVTVGSVTVKIYSRTKAGRTVFEVADYSRGTRRLRMFTDREAARREAECIARLLAAGEAHAARMSGRDAAAFGRAVELLRPTGLPLEVAAATVAEAFKILGSNRIIEAATEYARRHPENLPAKPVADVVAEFLENQAQKVSQRHWADRRARLGRFAAAFQCNLGSVTGPLIQRWLDALQVAPQTVKNYRAAIYQLFRFAERRGYIPKGTNPVVDVENPKIKGSAIAIYTPSEMARLLDAAPPAFVPPLAIGAFAGLRVAEILRMNWKDVDFEAGYITVGAAQSKTASRRIVPLLPNLAAWLAPHAKKTGLVWPGTPAQFCDAQRDTAAAAGIKWRTNALRHSWISCRLAVVQNAPQVALEAGNSPQIVFRHYRELVKPSAAQAWFEIRPKSPANIVPIAQTA